MVSHLPFSDYLAYANIACSKFYLNPDLADRARTNTLPMSNPAPHKNKHQLL